MKSLSEQEALICGYKNPYLCSSGRFSGILHKEVAPPFLQLQSAAKKQGFNLQIASGYRSFERQLLLWNDKVHGMRPVLGDNNNPIDMSLLTNLEKIERICRWSAIPGSSRHHWGTDIDIYDRQALAPQAALQLTTKEAQTTFIEMYQWLEGYLPQTDFYRPYANDHGGLSPECWHLSYRPLAQHYERAGSPALLKTVLLAADIALKKILIANIDALYRRFIYREPA